MTKITTAAIKLTMISTKRKISFWMGVNSCRGLLVSPAMRPNTVVSPVATQMPVAVPATQ